MSEIRKEDNEGSSRPHLVKIWVYDMNEGRSLTRVLLESDANLLISFLSDTETSPFWIEVEDAKK